MSETSKLAVITGGSSGIGLELAKIAAQQGYELILAADTPFDTALRELGNSVPIKTVEVDLSTTRGVDELAAAVGRRPIDVLCANAGHGLGHAFLDEEFSAVRSVVETNIMGNLDVLYRFGRKMRGQGHGRILITGSIAGYIPGSYTAVYNATKAFLNNFSYAFRYELKDTGVSVTCLMPYTTESNIWERGGYLDTKAATGPKDPPQAPAKAGWEAMLAGEAAVSPGILHTLQRELLNLIPNEMLAKSNAAALRPGSANE